MINIPQISDSELEVMKALWEDAPMTSAEIVKKLSIRHEWKPKTIQTLITRLVAKDALQVLNPNDKPFLYKPIVSQSQYQAYANQSFLKRLYNGSLNLMLSSFVKQQSLTEEEINQLKQILEKGQS